MDDFNPRTSEECRILRRLLDMEILLHTLDRCDGVFYI
jgi:hypothetical protein